MDNILSKSNKFPISDCSSSSSSDSDSDGNSSSSSESETQEEPVNKQTNKNVKETNKQVKNYTTIRPVKLNAITKQINCMKGPLYNLLRNTNGHEYIILSLNKIELKTIRNIFLSVQNLKQIKQAHGFYKLPKDTKKSFIECKNEIDHFYKQSKKTDLQKSLLAINKKDNFKSIRRILTTNAQLSHMQKRILHKQTLKNGKK